MTRDITRGLLDRSLCGSSVLDGVIDGVARDHRVSIEAWERLDGTIDSTGDSRAVKLLSTFAFSLSLSLGSGYAAIFSAFAGRLEATVPSSLNLIGKSGPRRASTTSTGNPQKHVEISQLRRGLKVSGFVVIAKLTT